MSRPAALSVSLNAGVLARAAEDAAAVRAWLLDAAQAAANAAKEGFMGFHAERVSEGGQRMLDSLAKALSASPA